MATDDIAEAAMTTLRGERRDVMPDWIAVGVAVRLIYGPREGVEGIVEAIDGGVVFVRLAGGRWSGLLVPATPQELGPK